MADHFTIYWDANAGKWVAVGVINATDPTNANGLAAIKTRNNGKYASWTVAAATTDQVELQETADTTTVAFNS